MVGQAAYLRQAGKVIRKIDLLKGIISSESCSHDEASALLQFKHSLSIDRTYSDVWDYCHGYGIKLYLKTDSWKEGTDCCSWDGVTCDNIKGHVIGLDLSCSLLYGTVPSHSSLFLLPHLQKLVLASNNFHFATISPKFGEFASLVYLNLCCSYFSGQIASALGNLTKLIELDTSCNYLSGQIPSALGNLTKLINLDMSFNYLGGQIPSFLIRNLSQLEYLNLRASHLEGSIPDEVSSFPNLINLDLYANSFNGTLPSWLFTIPSLTYIDLSFNQFSGRVKEFQYHSLIFIHLSSNELQGPIPSSISKLLNLTYLDLSSNKLQGPILSSILQLPNLVYLGLASNNLSGIVEIGMFSKLQNLQYLCLSSNSLSLIFNGTNDDYTLPKLQDLYLSSCTELPWKKIEILDLSSNLIHGDLPIPPLTTQIFFISKNSISGEIPSLICNLTSLGFVDVSHNNLSGIIPQCFGNLSKSAELLNLRMNKFHGIIPTFLKGVN
ncbi:hypothetical protein PTKIN_Ptkin14bG0008300 [Pterospermum kingtungense]